MSIPEYPVSKENTLTAKTQHQGVWGVGGEDWEILLFQEGWSLQKEICSNATIYNYQIGLMTY